MKRVISLILAAVLSVLLITLPASAETYTDKAIIIVSKKNATVGDTVSVTITQTSSYAMAAIEGELKYNDAVLQFVSGEDSNTANSGSTVKIVKDSAPTNSISVSVKFKAIAAGSGSLSYKGNSYSDNDDGSAAAGTAINVEEDKPSTDNNLGSLRINHGTLTPAFKASRLEYTATVKYDVTNITISANAAAGDAKVAGVGTFDLKVGNNTRSITVTAASGDKKTYTVKIKRLKEEKKEEEDKKDDEEEEEEPDDASFYFSYNGVDRLVVPDIADLPDYEGYTKDTFESNNAQVGYYKDNAGKYNLVPATDEYGENPTFFNREAEENYTEINYLETEGRLYVIEPFEADINVNSKFVLSSLEMNGERLDCYRYSDLEFKDYCVFYCYINGQSDYYRFETTLNTVEPVLEFISEAEETDAGIDTEAEAPQENIIEGFKNLGTQAKTLILLLCFSGLLIIVLIILLIVKAASGKKDAVESDYEDDDLKVVEEEITEKAESETPVAEETEDTEAVSAEEIEPEPDEVEEAPGEVAEAPEEEPEEAGEEPEDKPEDKPASEDIDTNEFIDMDEDN